MPEGQINDPSQGKYFSLPFLPSPPSSPFWTLEGPFEQTRLLQGLSTRPMPCFLSYRETKTPSGVLS